MQERSTVELENALSQSEQLGSFLEENADNMPQRTISERLAALIVEKGVSKSSAIAASGLNDIYAHQIFAGKRKPSRDKLLCLCFGFALSAQEAQGLLRTCGYAPLYVKARRDSIIYYAFCNKMTLLQCNELLFDEKEPLL